MSKDKAPRDEVKIEHKKIMCPDCSQVFTFSSVYKSDEYAALESKLAECVAFIEDLKSSPELSRTLVGLSVQQAAREVLAKVKK